MTSPATRALRAQEASAAAWTRLCAARLAARFDRTGLEQAAEAFEAAKAEERAALDALCAPVAA